MSWDAWSIPNPKEEQTPTWGDYGKAALSTAAGIGAGGAGLLRDFYEQGRSEQGAGLWRSLQGAARTVGEDVQASMTPEGRERFQAGVTSEKFWEHPFSSTALKATGMTPYIAAAAIPGALVGEGAAALAAAGVAGGVLGAGDVVESIYAKTDKMSDNDLKEQSTLYRGLRADMGVEDARREYNQTIIGMKPAIAFALGIGSGVFGPAGNIVRGLQPELKGATLGAKVGAKHGIKAAAAEGAASELVEEGYGAVAGQKAEIEGGTRTKYDTREILDQALTGALLGGTLGGATGIGGGKGKAKADEIKANRAREEGTDIQAPAAGAEAAEPISPAAKAAAKKGVTIVEPGGVAPDEALALGTEQVPAPKPKVDDVAPDVPPPAQAAQPNVPPAQPDVPPAPSPAAQPQQPATVPPVEPAAAPVTSGVTEQPPPGSPHTPEVYNALRERMFTSEEINRLTPEQAQEVLKTPVPGGAGIAPQKPTSTETTQGASPAATTDTSTVPSNQQGSEASVVEPVAIPSAGTAGTATSEQVTETKAKPKHKKGVAYDKSTAQRAEHAKALYDEHREPFEMISHDQPVKREVRNAMAARIQLVLDKAAKLGLVPRESLPDAVRKEGKGQTPEQKHARAMSIPEKAAGDTSAHVIYLRELIGVRNALLGKDFGPKSDERQRVLDFIAEHNVGEGGLKPLAERRLQEGRQKKAVRGSGVAAKATKVLGGSEDRKAGEGRVLTGEEKAALAKQYEKPGVGPAGAGILAKQKTEKPTEGATEISVGAEPSAPDQVATAPASTPSSTTRTEPAKPESKGKIKAKEIKDKGRRTLSGKPAPDRGKITPEELAQLEGEGIEVSLKPTGAAVIEAKKAKPKAAEPVREVQPQTAEERAEMERGIDEAAAKKLGIPVEQATVERKERIAGLGRMLKGEAEPVAKEQQGEKVVEKTEEKTPPSAPAEVATPPEKVSVTPKPKDTRVIDTETKQFLKAKGYTELDIKKMSYDRAVARADLGTQKKEGVTQRAVKSSAVRAKLAALTPKQREAFNALRGRHASESADSLKRLQDMGKEAWVAKRLPLQENVYPLKDRQSREDLEADYDVMVAEFARRAEQEGGKRAKGGEEVSQKQIQKAGKQVEADMTPAEFAALNPEEFWRALQAKVRGEIFLYSHEFNKWPTTAHKAQAVYGHAPGSITAPIDSNTVLKDYVHLSHLGDLPKAVQDFVRKRLAEVLDRVPVYVMTREVFDDTLGSKRASGFFDDSPNKSGKHGYIAIPEDVAADPEHFASTMIHEALHAALHNKINSDPKFSRQIKILMNELDYRTKNSPARKFLNYSLTNEHEFISELGSNETLQMVMSEMHLRPEISESLGLPPTKPISLWGAFISKVRQTFGLAPVKGMDNFLDSALRVLTPQMEAVQREAGLEGHYQAYKSEGKRARMTTDELLNKAAVGIGDGKINLAGSKARGLDKLSTMRQLVERGAKLFGAADQHNPLNQMFDLRAKMERYKDVILEKYGGLRATLDLAKAERADPEGMAKGKEVAFELSRHDINPDGPNDHMGKDRMMTVQAKGEIARLKAAWNDPALDSVRDALRQAGKFYKDIHNAVSRATIKNILAEANIHDEALVDRIHQHGLTEADQIAWANTKLLSALEAVRALKRREGFYVPFRRYGEFVSAAEHELSVPSTATKVNDNTLQFVAPNQKNMAARALAKSYLRSNSHTPQGNKLNPVQVKKVWVDKNDHSKLMEGTEPDAIPAYRVSMQIEHVEMHKTEAEAKNNQDDLTKSGLLNARSHKREDAYAKNLANIQSAMGTVLRSLEKQQRFIDADATQKAAMREMFHDLTLGLSGNTSIKNSMRQRRNVAGESHDLGRVTADYAQMTTNHLAKLEYRPQMDAMFKQMREHMAAYVNDKDNIRRKEIYDEFINRIYGKAADQAEAHRSGFVSRVIQMTRLSFLAGPSFHIINMHEVLTTAMPIIAGRHGLGATLRAIKDTYNLIGARSALAAGFKDTVKAYTDDTGFTNYVKLFKDTIGKSQFASADKIKRQQDMIDYMNDRNLFSGSSIFEAAKYADPNAKGVLGYAGRILDRADLMANQVGSAIESMNRTVTGLVAYNLEYKRNGGNHEAAMHYAYSTAHNTMGDYSSWNAAPIFNSKYGRPILQFKKFPQKTYALLGNLVGGIAKGDPQAMKQFAGLMVTHGMIAGVLGLPTEPFKVALAAANAVGLTGFTPEDYDYAVRKMMADLLGKKGGEIASRGLYRGVGIEVSGRMGLDSLLLRSMPKSQKEADIKSFLFDTMAGASASYLWNQVEGARAALKGDWTTAIEKMSPLRTIGDVTKAGVGLYGDKKNAAGKTTQEQFTAWEAAVRLLGFTPSRADEFRANRVRQASESKQLSEERSAVIKAWVNASGGKKVDAQRSVQKFNEGRHESERITAKDLSNAAKRSEREEKTLSHGVPVTNRTTGIRTQAESVFNF